MKQPASCLLQQRPNLRKYGGILLILLTSLIFSPLLPAFADGGAEATPTPQPDDKAFPAGASPVTPTGGVTTFNIIIEPGATPTILQFSPSNTQAALTGDQALKPASSSQPTETKFESPLWLFAFILIILVIAAGNSLRNRVHQ